MLKYFSRGLNTKTKNSYFFPCVHSLFGFEIVSLCGQSLILSYDSVNNLLLIGLQWVIATVGNYPTYVHCETDNIQQ